MYYNKQLCQKFKECKLWTIILKGKPLNKHVMCMTCPAFVRNKDLI